MHPRSSIIQYDHLVLHCSVSRIIWASFVATYQFACDIKFKNKISGLEMLVCHDGFKSMEP